MSNHFAVIRKKNRSKKIVGVFAVIRGVAPNKKVYHSITHTYYVGDDFIDFFRARRFLNPHPQTVNGLMVAS